MEYSFDQLLTHGRQLVKASALSEKDSQKKTLEMYSMVKFIDACFREIQLSRISESPDFILLEREKKIGCELVDLVVYPKIKEREGFLKDLASEIEKEVSGTEITPQLLSVSVTDNFKVSGEHRAKLKAEVLDLIHSIPSNVCFLGSTEINSDYIRTFYPFEHDQWHIYFPEGSSGSVLERITLSEIIDKKHSKLEEYRLSNCDEYWLMIVDNGIYGSSCYSFLSEEITNNSFASGFDRIFLFDNFKCEVEELKVTKS